VRVVAHSHCAPLRSVHLAHRYLGVLHVAKDSLRILERHPSGSVTSRRVPTRTNSGAPPSSSSNSFMCWLTVSIARAAVLRPRKAAAFLCRLEELKLVQIHLAGRSKGTAPTGPLGSAERDARGFRGAGLVVIRRQRHRTCGSKRAHHRRESTRLSRGSRRFACCNPEPSPESGVHVRSGVGRSV